MRLPFHWRVRPGSSTAYLHLEGCDGSEVLEPDGSWRPLYSYHASVKFDGCVEYNEYANGYEWGHQCSGEDCECCLEVLHICDIDAMIARLQALKDAAREHFGGTDGSGSGEEAWSGSGQRFPAPKEP